MNKEPENEICGPTTFAGEEQHSVNSSYTPIEDTSFDNNYMAEFDIQKFLNRPVLIATKTMLQGAGTKSDFNVWQLYFNTPQIKKKLDNYFLINCNLKLKFVINATPFLYGAALVSYEPLPAFSADNVAEGVNTAAPTLRSQRPHLWLYPQTSQGGEMLLPFYYYQEWLNLTSQGDVTNMGILTIEDIVALQSASGATSQVATIQVYAWAENVKLAGPTYSLALQNDEYDMNGPVSSVASAVSAASEKLGKIPIVGKYFKATSVFTRGLGAAASILGYTNVPVIEPTKPMYIQTLPTFASSEISFPENKLTYDPKNELTVDPRVVGLNGVDEMDISNIVQRESYLTQFTWAANAAVNTTLFSLNVRPSQRNYVAPRFVSNTPMAHIAQLFEYWRGDIIVRFRFVCSQYHRGRARIIWDPNGDVINNNDTTPTSINMIVDISETTDVEIRIPYMQPFAWARCTDAAGITDVFHQRGFIRDVGIDNGNLAVKVFTNQTSQVSSANVFVLVSVRGAENLEFSNPRELPNTVKYFNLQSNTYELESPTRIGVETNTPDHKYVTHMGEAVRNLRTVLRRRSLYRVQPNGVPGTTTDLTIIYNYANRLPAFPGYDPLGLDTARNNANNANVAYNWVKNTPYHWLAGCYLGCRGSVNYYYLPLYDNSLVDVCSFSAQRFPQAIAGNPVTTATFNVPGANQYTNITRFFAINTVSNNSGACETVTKTSATLGVQYPFYSRFRMRQCDPTKATRGSSLDDSNIDNVLVTTTQVDANTTAGQHTTQSLKTYFGIGTDFAFLFFLNVPVLYVYNDPAAPS